jgi:N utilization substance protein B
MSRSPSSRRAARETALRVLYTVDVGKQPIEDVLAESAEAAELDDKGRLFLQTLVAGTQRNQVEIDAQIDRFAIGFPVDRQTVVDRNILRLATAEILYGISDAPPGAVVNEAVELAKKYSTKESGRFVNGVLGAVVREAEARGGGGGTADRASGGDVDTEGSEEPGDSEADSDDRDFDADDLPSIEGDYIPREGGDGE